MKKGDKQSSTVAHLKTCLDDELKKMKAETLLNKHKCFTAQCIIVILTVCLEPFKYVAWELSSADLEKDDDDQELQLEQDENKSDVSTAVTDKYQI